MNRFETEIPIELPNRWRELTLRTGLWPDQLLKRRLQDWLSNPATKCGVAVEGAEVEQPDRHVTWIVVFVGDSRPDPSQDFSQATARIILQKKALVQRLAARAKEAGKGSQELLRERIQQWLDDPTEDFEQASAYVIEKNRELYKRLAQ